jgi:hypothetical protein
MKTALAGFAAAVAIAVTLLSDRGNGDPRPICSKAGPGAPWSVAAAPQYVITPPPKEYVILYYRPKALVDPTMPMYKAPPEIDSNMPIYGKWLCASGKSGPK